MLVNAVISKNWWFKNQNNIKNNNLIKDEKIEFWSISFEDLTEKQKNNFLEAKKMKDSEFVNL